MSLSWIHRAGARAPIGRLRCRKKMVDIVGYAGLRHVKKSPVFGSCHQTSGWSPDLHGSVFEIAVRNLEPVEIQSLWKMKMVSLSATQEPFLWIRTPFAVFYMSSSRPRNPANPCSYFLQSCRSSVRQRQTKWENSFDLGKWSHGDRGNLFWLYCTKWWTNFNSSGSAAVSCVGSIALILISMVVLLTFHFSKLGSKFSKEFCCYVEKIILTWWWWSTSYASSTNYRALAVARKTFTHFKIIYRKCILIHIGFNFCSSP